ncbi:uncharacterized protein LOC133799964 [Humulus lupulus]|uniref:uncharacterized protein LOC133799964 n=1 Tax=Humulus lupulus TaxID=3486 RepID=UPI002B4133C9|nr:uncharacterized protein LOC133799964 [Humulus lupulus]
MQPFQSICQPFLVSAQKVLYAGTVWNKLLVPKHRFIYWQILNSHLLTRDQMSRILPIQSVIFPVCASANESHSHLFLDCIFSRKLFGEVSCWLSMFQWPKSYLELQQWCMTAINSLQNQVINAVFAATLYFIWKNRNKCIFDSVCFSTSSLSLEIRKIVKYRVLGLSFLQLSKRDNYILNVVKGW